jgi:hypothetical protein
MKTKNKPQRQKSSKVQQVQELRRSNAAQPIPSSSRYNRNEKYGLKWDDLDDDDNNPYLWR